MAEVTPIRRDTSDDRAVSLDVHYEVSRFLHREARLLDEERYRDWLAMLTRDIHYWIPFRQNRFRKDKRPAPTPETSANVFNDDYDELEDRVRRFETGQVWSEDPAPRMNRLVTNIEAEFSERDDELEVFSNIALYRNRRLDEEIWFTGKRRDLLRRVDGCWRLARRHVFLSHHVLLDENISMLF